MCIIKRVLCFISIDNCDCRFTVLCNDSVSSIFRFHSVGLHLNLDFTKSYRTQMTVSLTSQQLREIARNFSERTL